MTEERKTLREEKKSTRLAKFLRILRIQNDELLGNMADKLGIKPSYLSAIEANRRPLTSALKERLIEKYSLDSKQQAELDSLIAEADRSVEVDLSSVRNEAIYPKYVNTAMLFARDISTLDEEELEEIQKMLISFKKQEGN